MKNLVIVIIAFLCPIISIFPQKHLYEWDNLKMKFLLQDCKKNGIKELKVTKIDYEYGVPLNWGIIIKDYKYDDHFNLIEQNLWDELDYAGKIIYQYNSKNDTILIKKLNKKDKEVYRIEFEYENDKLVAKKYFENDELEYIQYFKYNDKNQPIEVKRIKENELDFIEYYEYDEQGKLNKFSFFDEDSVEKIKSIITYTPTGLINDSVVYFDGIEDAKFEFKYDAKGNLVEWIYSSPELGLIERKTYKYDVYDRLTEMKVFDDQDVMVELYYGYYDNQPSSRLTKLEIYGENEFLIGIWHYKYFENNLLKNEQYLNKLELPQFLNKYEYEPKQR